MQDQLYESVSSKKGMFKLKSRLTDIGETFDLYLQNELAGSFGAQGITDFFDMFEAFAEKYRVANK
jgi:hypothetical protein